MAIDLIPNQQFVFEEIDNCCDDNKKYCQKIADGEDVFVQFKQRPCSDNLVCDFVFLGDEMVTNGDFVTDPTLLGWTLGTNWIWDSVNKFIRHQNGSIGNATLAIVLTNADQYFLSFDVEFLIPHASQSLTPSVGGTAGLAVTVDGRYGMIVTAGVADTVNFLANQFTDCSIDNVSLKLYSTTCWDFDAADIQLSESGACHISDDEATITQSGILVIGVLYQVVIVISGMTQGYVTVQGGTIISEQITANGTQTVFIIADGNDFSIILSEDFDGCINDGKVYALRQDFQWVIKDVNNNLIADLNPSANPTVIEADGNQWVTLKMTADLGAVLDINGDDVSFGCYKVCFYDPCPSSIESFAGRGDADAVGFSEWTPSDPDIISSFIGFRGWLMVTDSNGDGTAILTTNNVNLSPINNWTHAVMQMLVQVDFTTGQIEDGTNRVYINLPNNQKILLATNVVSNTAYSFHSILITVDNTGGATFQDTIRIICEFDSAVSGNENEIRALIVTTIPMDNQSDAYTENQVEYCSNCYKYEQEFDCHKMLKGVSDEDYSLGFYFGGTFELKNRLNIKMVTPTYPKEVEEELFSDGSREMTFGQGEKYWTVKVAGDDGVDEATHDNINAMLLCDTLLIDTVEYFPKKDEYKPNHDRLGESKLSQSEFLVKKKNQTIFNRNV